MIAVNTVDTLSNRTRKRLVVIPDASPVIQAARLLTQTDTSLVVVCNPSGQIAGVVTKADVVREISTCTGCSCTAMVSDVMTRDVKTCQPEQSLLDVWDIMKTNSLKQIPVRDQESRPLGVLYANDALETLLNQVEQDELLLRDYVMGIGYR